MNVKIKCEKCNIKIKVFLSHYLIRKIFKIKDLELLCTECYFK